MIKWDLIYGIKNGDDDSRVGTLKDSRDRSGGKDKSGLIRRNMKCSNAEYWVSEWVVRK